MVVIPIFQTAIKYNQHFPFQDSPKFTHFGGYENISSGNPETQPLKVHCLCDQTERNFAF
jgi:hypothetical protein